MNVSAWLIDFVKGTLAFFAALFSVCLGLYLAVASFSFAVAIQIHLWLLLPCLLLVALAFCFLIVIPRYLYWWRFGFPKVAHRSKSSYLARLRKSQPF